MKTKYQNLMCMERLLGCLCCVIGLTFSGQGTADDSFDKDESVATESILPSAFLKSGAYEFEDSAYRENLFYRFSVETNFGRLRISSIAMLRRRLGEVTKLDELQRARPDDEDALNYVAYSEDDVYSDALGTAWRIRRPTDSGETASVNVEPEATDGDADKDSPSIQWRTAAARVGLDPHSSFPPVKSALQVLSKQLGTSRFPNDVSAVAAARIFEARLPLDDNFEFETATVIKNSTTSELRAETTRLLNAAGVDLPTRVRFLNNAAYIESDRYRFARLLESVAKLDGKSLLVAGAASVETEVDALAYLNYMRLVSGYNDRAEPLVRILGITRYPALVSSEGVGLLALPIDILPWNERTSELAAELVRIRDKLQLEGFTVLILGKPTERARGKLDEMGVRLIEGISL
ncbi:MAG: hypothetical protein ACU84Q_16700 [Gammaproteobacteria bacterium]